MIEPSFSFYCRRSDYDFVITELNWKDFDWIIHSTHS